ncbi:hypothetical protein BgiMline_001108 [Biomphalaria glabrata]|nr:hypothetical protein BgiMline_001022 [Biomphalaria glabrata]
MLNVVGLSQKLTSINGFVRACKTTFAGLTYGVHSNHWGENSDHLVNVCGLSNKVSPGKVIDEEADRESDGKTEKAIWEDRESDGKTEKVMGRQRKRWEDRESDGKTEKAMGRQRKRWEDRESDGKTEKAMGRQRKRYGKTEKAMGR